MEKAKLRMGIYRHFKGGLYDVFNVATHTETGETLVVYRGLVAGVVNYDNIWCRPIEMFMSEVDKEKYPDAKQQYRFEYIEESKQPF